MSLILSSLLTMISGLIAMTFYTLLERKALGYFQIRKGPNKVSMMGLPQPFADAIKLFTKERLTPMFSNTFPFMLSPAISLCLALLLWSIYPHKNPTIFMAYSAILMLAISSLSVYTTLAAGWTSNSKYALLGALRSIAQTISYEISMALILLSALLIFSNFNMSTFSSHNLYIPMLMMSPIFLMWFITTLAETNRTPFDFAEGESELVSGFNTEYSSSGFALIFMAEYSSIIIMSIFSATIFLNMLSTTLTSYISLPTQSMFIAFLFIWVRASFPRMRYDRLMMLTWKSFLPAILSVIIMLTPMILSI